MTAIQGVFYLSPSDIPVETPNEVRAAIGLLQAHGYTILPEPVSAVAATVSVVSTSDVEDPQAKARATCRMLFPAVGRAVAAVAAVTVAPIQNDTREISAAIYVARPRKAGCVLDMLTKEFQNDGTRQRTRAG
jgi:hypothetical protein